MISAITTCQRAYNSMSQSSSCLRRSQSAGWSLMLKGRC